MPPHRPVMERLMEKWARDEITGCWRWTGSLSEGYGRIGLHGRMYYAHRLTYEHFVGAIPAGMEIDHLCRNRDCCNPEHLEAVTRQTNVERGDRCKRTHCRNGHAFDEANTRISPHGWQECRACGRENQRRIRQRREAA